MLDILVVCEGQTEREFCREVVAPYLAPKGIHLAGTLVGKPQRKRGGIHDWPIYRNDLLRLAKERADRHVAVLVDYYAMPESWPGRVQSKLKSAADRGRHVEEELVRDLEQALPGRFHPCVQLHEFESLLFVDPDISALSLAVSSNNASATQISLCLQEIKQNYDGLVEQINDSPETAPSKRLKKIVIGYDKVAWGITAAKDVSIETLRSGCPWLDRWLTRLIEQAAS